MFGPSMGKWYANRTKPIDWAPVHRIRMRRSGLEFEAMRLLWPTWSQICDFANVGVDTEKMCIGVYLDAYGEITSNANGNLGLRIPLGPTACMLAAEGDWIV